MLARLRTWAVIVKQDTLALYLAMRDPRVAWPAKALAAVVVGYAFSPIDLIPDVIPVIGHLDDLVLLPLGIMLVIRLIPPSLMQELRQEAARRLDGDRPTSRTAAVVIVAVWLLVAAAAGRLAIDLLSAGGD